MVLPQKSGTFWALENEEPTRRENDLKTLKGNRENQSKLFILGKSPCTRKLGGYIQIEDLRLKWEVKRRLYIARRF